MTSRPPPPDQAQNPDPSQQVWTRFKAALDAMAPETRAVFLLHDAFGLHPDDIAILIGQPADACRHILELARRTARERIPLRAEHGAPPSS